MYKEKVLNLLSAIQNYETDDLQLKDDLFMLVSDGMKNFVKYVNSVYAMETQVAIARFRVDDPQKFRDIVSELDQSRRTAHDSAISYTNAINRLCDQFGIDPLYHGTQDRVDIGDFCGDIVDEYFQNRSNARVITKPEVNKVIEKMGFEL